MSNDAMRINVALSEELKSALEDAAFDLGKTNQEAMRHAFAEWAIENGYLEEWEVEEER